MQRNMIRATYLAASALALSSGLPAQLTQEELIAEREKKLAKPVFRKAKWIFDYDEARAEARKRGAVLLTYFTRSYAY